MVAKRTVVQITRWGVFGGLLLVGLWLLNLAAFHAWASSGPPTPNPEWHAMWAERYFWGAITSLGTSGIVAFALRRRGDG
jgi:hypothetical protein